MARKWWLVNDRYIGSWSCYDTITNDYLSNAMSGPRLILHTFRYTNIIINLYNSYCLLFTERLVNDLLRNTQQNLNYFVENMYMPFEHMQQFFFYPKKLYISILYMQPTCSNMFETNDVTNDLILGLVHEHGFEDGAISWVKTYIQLF